MAATKNKHLKIVTFLRIGVRNLSSIGKKKKKNYHVCICSFTLSHNNTVFKRAVIMISILLLRKLRGHNLFKITQQINGLKLEPERRPLVLFSSLFSTPNCLNSRFILFCEEKER